MKIQEQILLQTEELIAVNKPSGLLTIPDREGVKGLKNLLQEQFDSVFTIHRLDKETSGVVVFARTEEAHRFYSQQFENRETKKIYNGLVLGQPVQDSGVINEPITEHPVKKGMMTVYRKGKESITEYQKIEQFRLFAWMQFHILTGRTHQIRVHMKHLGNPVVCDPLYGDGKPVFVSQIKQRYNLAKTEEEERPLVSRLALHASILELRDMNGAALKIEAPLPKDLKAVLQQLRKYSS